MLFVGTAGDAPGKSAIDAVLANANMFDDDNICFFGVTIDPRDEQEGRLNDRIPGIRHFWDFDGEVSRTYGAIPTDAKPGPQRIRASPVLAGARSHAAGDGDVPLRRGWSASTAVFDYLRALPPHDRFAGIAVHAPVLVLPNVFEPEFCKRLIDLYDTNGGESSGFMQEVDGKTVMKQDANRKVRKDYLIEDEDVDQADPAARPAADRAGDPEGPSVQRQPHGALHRRLLFGRRRADISSCIATTPPRAPPTAASPSRSTSTANSTAAS